MWAYYGKLLKDLLMVCQLAGIQQWPQLQEFLHTFAKQQPGAVARSAMHMAISGGSQQQNIALLWCFNVIAVVFVIIVIITVTSAGIIVITTGVVKLTRTIIVVITIVCIVVIVMVLQTVSLVLLVAWYASNSCHAPLANNSQSLTLHQEF